MPLRFLLWVGLVCASLCYGQDVARMEDYIDSYVKRGQFMGTVLVARGDEVLLNKGYGFANLEWQVPNTPTTKFRLGSLTKQFTAAAILLLEERGKLKLGDPVKNYLPDAPAAWDKVTIYHLLTHTSGIPSFTGFPDYRENEHVKSTPEMLVARFRDKPLEFQPGEKWIYSNSGFVLLGYLLEKVTGESYEKFLRENVFDPLGMKDTGYDFNTEVIARRASGYDPGPKGPLNAGYIHMSIPFSAGALYSTTEDLLKWEQGLFGGKLLSPASLEKMITPFKQGYGYGIGIRTTKQGLKVIAHGGGIEGFSSFLAYYPADRVTVVVLGNLTGPSVEKVAHALADFVHGVPLEMPRQRTEIMVPAAKLAEYVGTYVMTPTFEIAVTLDGGQLFAQATKQPKFPVYAESEAKFFLKVVDAQIEFKRDAQGKVNALVLHQNGRDQVAKRKEASP
ncbi:MAG: serine hydrolase [Nibricoccus sp.]